MFDFSRQAASVPATISAEGVKVCLPESDLPAPVRDAGEPSGDHTEAPKLPNP